MYVDRFRYAKHPDVIAEAATPRLLSLFQHPRTKVRAALVALQGRDAANQALAALADDESRAIFRDLLAYRIWGPAFSRLANDRERYEALEGFMAAPMEVEEIGFHMENAVGETLRLWHVDYAGNRLELMTSKYGLYWTFLSDQYRFERRGVRVGPEAGDVIIDAGAFLGETAVRFALDAGPAGRVYGFDAFAAHTRLAEENAKRNGLGERVRFYAGGLAARSNISGLDALITPAPGAGEERPDAGRRMTAEDPQVSLDDFCRWAKVDKVDYIKMDIEGSEIMALEGAHQTIEKHRPKLGICVYHRPDDLWVIPNLIRQKYPFYQLYLDHHSLYGEETVLYARPS